ncbi:MAG: nickel insertion protein, partial [Nostoc sp.]
KGQLPEKVIANVQPEYEDCADLARKHHIPWREIHRLALQRWYLENQHY